MTRRHTIGSGATRASLNAAINSSPEYLHPILEAVRDHGIAMMFVPQDADPFCLPRSNRKPTIILVGDDFEAARGPAGFHMPSIRRAIRACSSFAVVSSAPQPAIYAAVAFGVAAMLQHAMLIETRPKQEIAWLALIQKVAPGRLIQLATVKGGHA